MKRILFLDFDGPLAIPWTMPEMYHEHIPSLIEQLAKNDILCLVSFNPRAIQAIESWNLHSHFTAFRAGSNHPLLPGETYSDEKHRIKLSKASQIESILSSELKDIEKESLHFYDDDESNIKNVSDVFGEKVSCNLVQTWFGLSDKI